MPPAPSDGSDGDRTAAYIVEVQQWLDTGRKRGENDLAPLPDSIMQPISIEVRLDRQVLASNPTNATGRRRLTSWPYLISCRSPRFR